MDKLSVLLTKLDDQERVTRVLFDEIRDELQKAISANGSSNPAGGGEVPGAELPGKSSGIYERAGRLLDDLEDGKKTPSEINAAARALAVQGREVERELGHAKATKRLKEGSPELPGYVRTPPQ